MIGREKIIDDIKSLSPRPLTTLANTLYHVLNLSTFNQPV